jgi:hypothetical protein
MAFIREYAAMSGDPFRFRLPKFLKPPKALRKFQPGKALGKLASFVGKNIGTLASFVPVMGPALGKVFDRAMSVAASIPGGQDQLLSFARSYGYDTGDPRDSWGNDWSGDPGAPKPARKRKQAAAGPKVKAARKANARAAKGPGVLKRIGKGTGAAVGAIAQNFPGLLEAFNAAGGAGEALGHAAAGAIPGLPRLPGARGFGGHRRTMNPLNLKALRRSTRRLEGFEKVVKRVAPHLLTRGRIASGHRTRHKSGCTCAVCKRR